MVEAARPRDAESPEARDAESPEAARDIRAAEQAALVAALDAERGSVVLLHGPRGVGKARLAEHLKQTAAQRPDIAIFEARCPAAGARSFHPFAELARQAMEWAEQRSLTERLVDPVYADLAPVVNHAASEAPEEAEAPSLDQKLAFFEGFRRLLAGVAGESRLAAIVHDLERADTDTLELAGFLADELFGDAALDPDRAGRGVLLLLARDDDAVEPRARDFVAEVEAQRSATTIALEGLDLDGLRTYVQSPHLLEKLLAASSGLPQEIDALIDALPTNVEELFERRLDALEPRDRDVLVALAVSGRPASARQLAEVTRFPVKDVAKSLNTLRAARIVARRIQSGELQFSFTRRRDLEVAQRSVAAEDRARLHGGWAKALLQDGEGSGPALLAYHQLRSSEPRRGVPLAIQAAETHAVAGAINAALQLLEDARPHAQGELELAVLSRLAELAPLTRNPHRALRFVEEWKAALAPEARGPALLREAELRSAAGDHQLALEAVEKARELVDASQSPVERARIEAAASEACYNLGRHDDARERCELGLEVLDARAEQSSGTRVRIELLNQLGKIALAEGDPRRAIRFFEETKAAAESRVLISEEARALVNLGLVRARLGEREAAKETLQLGIRKAREANDLVRLAFGRLNLGTLLHQAGELGPAIEAYRECRALFRRLGNRTQLARALNNLGNLHYLCGDLERARAYNDEALRLAELSGVERVVGMTTVVDGVILGEQGQLERAEARLREGMLLQQKGGGERPIEALLELSELQHRGGHRERARGFLEEARAALEALESPVLAARARYLTGLLAPEAEDAVEILEAARDAFATLGRRLAERDAEVALARALARQGRSEMARVRLEAAQQLQTEAADTLEGELRATFLAARPQREIEVVQAELEGREPPRIEAPASAPTAPARPAPPAPVARKEEWSKRYGTIIGSSPKLMRVFHILDRVAQSEGTVLIAGESGTGKELVAEAIHVNSPRSKGPFVKLNCAALVESLLLSELFGHERGSFTGAHQRKIGRFEMAAGGTLFLDEIGDISPKTQVALLRVLQEREFERVGGGQTIALDARVVFATNRNLAQMVKDGTFREDLYYRLKGITIDLPPLRDRPQDIVDLAKHFLAEYAHESASPKKSLTDDALDLLVRYPWPGNIRELENIIRSVALFAETDAIGARNFDEYRELFEDAPNLGPLETSPAAAPPPAPRAPERPAETPASAPAEAARAPEAPAAAEPPDLLGKIFDEGIPLPDLKKQIQAEAIARALRMTEGNITRAAEVLGMRRPRLSQIINADEELKGLAQGATR